MVIAVARIRLHLPASQSLKDKRQIVKSLLPQLQRQFQLAAAEVEAHDKLQLAVVGLAYISTDAGHADSVIAHAVDFIARSKHDLELLSYETEVVHAF